MSALGEVRPLLLLPFKDSPLGYTSLRTRCKSVCLSSYRHSQSRRLHNERPARGHSEVSTSAIVSPRHYKRPYATVDSAAYLDRQETPSTPESFSSPSSLPPLSTLPLASVLRALLISTVSASPMLLTPSMGILSVMAHSNSRLLNPERNPVLKYILGQIVYMHFCAGVQQHDVKTCVQGVKDLGYSGVILGYAREVVMSEAEAAASLGRKYGDGEEVSPKTAYEITTWKEGTLDTVDLAGDGGFVAVKFTGAGEEALQQLLKGSSPSPMLERAMAEICERAKARNVRLLIDAEQQAVQPAIDAWTMELQRRFNARSDSTKPQRALIYNTYQAYLRSTPATLARHIKAAESEGFVLGVKLVRGAYIGTEPRHFIWAEKEDTDKTYNDIARALIRREYNDTLQSQTPPSSAQSLPEVDLILASHNRTSIQKAQELRIQQSLRGEKKIELSYGQIFGMADDISCALVQRGHLEETDRNMDRPREHPKVYKSLIWGSVRECMMYLVRRAQENKDAASRTLETRNAMAKELRRRIIGW